MKKEFSRQNQLEEVNKFRKMNGLPELHRKERLCISCKRTINTVSNRMCSICYDYLNDRKNAYISEYTK